jgi:hypothetical protein
MQSNCDECSGSSSGCKCDEATVEAKFYQMVDTLRDDHHLNITDMIAENCSCLQLRMSRVDGDERKKDLIFWEGKRHSTHFRISLYTTQRWHNPLEGK